MAMRQTSYGHTVFCDDIRLELGGKYSLMGVYSDVMYVSGTFPTLLPKFCMSVFVKVHPKDLPVNDMELLIFWPGSEDDNTPDIREIVPTNEIRFPTSPPDGLSEGDFLQWQANIGASPLALKTAGRIKVRAKLNGKLIKLGTLRVEQQQSNGKT